MHLTTPQRLLILTLGLPSLIGCERLYERLGLPDPARIQAEGRAIGGGCRHAGRGLEDCYALNPAASKAAIYEGWKEMHEYMTKHGLQAVAPQIVPTAAKGTSDKGEDAQAQEDTQPQGLAGAAPSGKAKGEVSSVRP